MGMHLLQPDLLGDARENHANRIAGAHRLAARVRNNAPSARPDSKVEKRKEIVEAWYRDQIRDAVLPLLAKWELVIGVAVNRFFVRQMKTKWGNCNPRAESIRLNTELAKKPRECLEYVMVHELTHLLEASHNARFITLMDGFIPQWRSYRDQLNQLPVRHEDWNY